MKKKILLALLLSAVGMCSWEYSEAATPKTEDVLTKIVNGQINQLTQDEKKWFIDSFKMFDPGVAKRMRTSGWLIAKYGYQMIGGGNKSVSVPAANQPDSVSDAYAIIGTANLYGGGGNGLDLTSLATIGHSNCNFGTYSMTMGYQNYNFATGAITMGINAVAFPKINWKGEFERDYQGRDTFLGNAIAIGNKAWATGDSYAIGQLSRAMGTNSVAIGAYATAGSERLLDFYKPGYYNFEYQPFYKQLQEQYPEKFGAYDSTENVFQRQDRVGKIIFDHYKDIFGTIGVKSYEDWKKTTADNPNATYIHDTLQYLGWQWALDPNVASATTAIGAGSMALETGAVALGASSESDRKPFKKPTLAPYSGFKLTKKNTTGPVSVGNANKMRQIINLADGTQDTDAVNIRQLKGLEKKIKEEMPTGNSSVTKAGDYVTVTEETKDKVTTYTVSGPKLISPDATIKITDLQDDKGNKTGYQLSIDSAKLNIRADTHVKEGAYQVGEITLADGKKTTGVTMAIVDQDGKDTGKSVIISDVASKTYVDNEIANINTKIDGTKVNIKAGDNVTIKEDTANKTYTISATDTKLKGNTNALSMNGTTLNLSLEDTAGTQVTGSVDLKAIQSAIDTNTTYTMTGTENDDNTTTITLKGSDGKEQKVTVATKDNDTYTTGGTYNKDTKKITFNRNDNKTYDVDLSGLADGIISAVDVVKSGEITDQGKIKLYKDDEKTKVIELEGSLKDASVKAGTYAVGKENTVVLDMKDNYSGKDLTEKVTIKDVAKASDVGNIYQFHKNVLNADGSKTTVTDAINNIDTRMTNIGEKVNAVGDRIDKAGAGAAALAALHPLDFDPDDKWDFAASYGHYHSRNAYALGAYYRPNEDTMLSIGGTIGGGEDMLNAGVSIKLGQGNNVSTSKVAMAREIKELRAIVEKQNGQIQKLEELVLGHSTSGLQENTRVEFPDLPKNHWAYEYVRALAERGLIAGYPDGEFKGGRQMTRYEFAAVIYRALQNGAVVDGQMTRAVAEFAPELEKVKLAEYFRIDTVMADGKGNPKIQRIRVSENN